MKVDDETQILVFKNVRVRTPNFRSGAKTGNDLGIFLTKVAESDFTSLLAEAEASESAAQSASS